MHVKDLIKQLDIVSEVKQLVTVLSFRRPCSYQEYAIFAPVVTDAESPCDSAHSFSICWLLIGVFHHRFYYHTVAWTMHKPKHLVKSIGTGEILFSGKGTDEGLMLKKTFFVVLRTSLILFVVLSSEDLHSLLATQR